MTRDPEPAPNTPPPVEPLRADGDGVVRVTLGGMRYELLGTTQPEARAWIRPHVGAIGLALQKAGYRIGLAMPVTGETCFLAVARSGRANFLLAGCLVEEGTAWTAAAATRVVRHLETLTAEVDVALRGQLLLLVCDLIATGARDEERRRLQLPPHRSVS